MGSKNPWLPTVAVPPDAPAHVVVAPTGATEPQPAVTPPEAGDQLRSFTVSTQIRLWVVGTHGGAAETTIAQLLDGAAAGHRWPESSPPASVLLTARTHRTGLLAAQLAMRAWAAGQTPHIRLVGLLLVADAPGKLPKPLADLAEVLKGGVPHMWQIPWVDQYRISVAPTDPPRSVRKVLHEINTVLDTTQP